MLVPREFVEKAMIADPSLGLLMSARPTEVDTQTVDKKKVMTSFGCQCQSDGIVSDDDEIG